MSRCAGCPRACERSMAPRGLPKAASSLSATSTVISSLPCSPKFCTAGTLLSADCCGGLGWLRETRDSGSGGRGLLGWNQHAQQLCAVSRQRSQQCCCVCLSHAEHTSNKRSFRCCTEGSVKPPGSTVTTLMVAVYSPSVWACVSTCTSRVSATVALSRQACSQHVPGTTYPHRARVVVCGRQSCRMHLIPA